MKKGVQLTALGVVLALAGAGLIADQDAAQPQQPTFKLRVDYVEVDVVVTDRDGNLVKDLKKDDFQVLEDGKPQSISAFTQVDIPIERADRPLYSDAPFEPDVRTNERPFDGRVYVMSSTISIPISAARSASSRRRASSWSGVWARTI
jgi:hypothetical protein